MALMWASAAIVGVTAYSVGLRGSVWLITLGVGLLPTQMILLATVARAFPPNLRVLTDGVLNLKPPAQ
jgi:hypothetical protein